VIRKFSTAAAFLPRLWPVTLNLRTFAPIDGEINIPGQNKIFVQLHIADGYVHCIGSDNLSVLDKIIQGVNLLPSSEEENIVDPSQFGRACLIRRLAASENLDSSALTIRRTKKAGELQPPRVYLNNKQAPLEISLSHDGRFTAYAFLRKSI
jgi:hypothetical protein